MNERYYSVGEVAERLGLHVRTVRNYVRDGRLRAVRVGKQYRITAADLEAFTGGPVPASVRESAGRERRAEASSVVEIDAVGPETAGRLSTLLTAAVNGPPGDRPPIRIQTAYDEERARLKVVILGGLGDTTRLLSYIEGILAS